ncbi:MAG: choice-of-anchor B family protein [Ignavibacteriae bacterium]|nr:choice-of-anchor B family protein [Ignavibacteriota bacterium]MCB9214726.1 choice-of-anchor B family protein [Ignavibacteria bacterium]
MSLRLQIILPLLALLGSANILAQSGDIPAKNITLFDHIEPITNADAGGLHNSCWGYVAPDGREYGFFGTQVGVYIIDITEKPIHQVGFIPSPKSSWRNIKFYKNFAYISTENRDAAAGAGLQIVDLSDLPDTAYLVRTDTTNFISAHTLWMADHYLYAMGTRAEAGVNGGAVILDLEPDPTNPRRVGEVDPHYFHDAFVRNDTLLGAAINGDGGDIYDISDKTNPIHLGTITYPFSGTHSTELLTDGRYAVTTDEVGFTPKTLKVWDISDPDDIVKVGEYTPNIVETIHNARIRGRYAYIAWYTAGVRIVDMVDPYHPREVGFFDTYQGRDGGFNGVWEVYPHFPSGKILASDRNSGLYVLEFNGARAGSISGIVRDAVTGNPIPNATVEVTGKRDAVTSSSAGEYYIGSVNGERVEATISHFGYRQALLNTTVDGDARQDIMLEPIPFQTFRLRAIDSETSLPIPDFSYTVDREIEPVKVNGEETEVALPVGVQYSLIVGKWGYQIGRRMITLDENTEEITVELFPGYQDDATLDLGWSFESPTDNAVTGRWNRLRPYLGYPNSDWVHPPTDPAGTDSRIFFTGQPPLFAPPERGDINSGRTTLTSPTMNLRGYSDPIIVFDRWYVEYARDTVLDSLVVELSNDNGSTWKKAYTEVKSTSGWKRVVIFPRDYIGLTEQVQIRLRASDTLGNILVVAGMDNFEVIDRVFSGVDEEKEKSSNIESLNITILPNPASSEDQAFLHLSGTGENLRVEIINTLGEVVAIPYDDFLPQGNHTLPLTGNLQPGWYIVRVVAGHRVGVGRWVMR